LLSKCANPACPQTLHYLRDGKIFKLELDSGFAPAKKGARRVEHFWLCGNCSQRLTIDWGKGKGPRVASKNSPMSGLAAS
jgi:hypothetical protein